MFRAERRGCDEELEKIDRLEAELARVRAERDVIIRLCYRRIETIIDSDFFFRIVLDTVERNQKTHDSEPEAIAFIRRLAGLDAPVPPV